MVNKIEEVKKEDNKIIIKEYVFTEREVSNDYLINVYNTTREEIENIDKKIISLNEEILVLTENIKPVEDYLIDIGIIDIQQNNTEYEKDINDDEVD